MTLADGRTGTAGAPLDEDPATSPRVLLAGVYTGDGPGSELLAAPLWDRSGRSSPDQGRLERVLDLHTGTLFERSTDADGGALRASLRFSSLPRPGVVALRSAGAAQRLPIGPPLVPVADAPAMTSGSTTDGVAWVVAGSESGGCAAASREWRSDHGAAAPPEAVARVERLAGYAGDGVSLPETAPAIERLAEAETLGFDRLLSEQRAAWAERWAAAGIDIEGDPELERAVRVALYHLIGSAASSGEAAVGARGLSGTAYRGHVFWDADVFVLPFLAATHPAAARAMLEYRLQRLPAARQAAALAGRKGARFPWESARTGDDVTPPFIRDLAGRGMTIGTGLMEEHVVADVAWAAQTYLDWTADRAFAAGPGAALLRETARYWASRIELDRDGRAHIYGVIGPDEYHEPVDDDAFTNVMARWNLRRGARQPGVSPRETATWRRLADALVDGYDPRTRIYEQCAGFHELEPLVISRTAPRRPVAADLLLGRERVRQAQIVKQPDVLMLHQMLPDAVHRGSLVPNLDYYEPRTAHGSSLSPGIHASLFARVGRDDEALEALRLTARLDLDDVTRTTAGGVHLGAMGSVWQALVHGFAGVRPHPRHLALDPRLPSAWSALEIPLQHAGRHLRIRIERDVLTLTTDNPLVIRLADGPMRRVAAGQTRYRRRRDDWEEETR
jgi:trehalose/maltose hydrolase-like predicted phosphorylase